MYIKDASGKMYQHFGDTREPVATDPHESSQFFEGTSATWKDLDTNRRGVLFDSTTREIIKPSRPTAEGIKAYLKQLERMLWLVNYETIPLPPHVSYGFKDMLTTHARFESQFQTDWNARSQYYTARRIMGFLKPPFVTMLGALQASWMTLGQYTGPGSGGVWNQINPAPTLPTGQALEWLCEEIADDYDTWEPKLSQVREALRQVAPIARDLATHINVSSSNMNSWKGAHIAPMQNFANTIQGMTDSIMLLSPPPSTSFNAIVSDQDPAGWVDDSMLEHRTFEFVPFNTGAADIPFLQGVPVSMITRVLERAKQELKSSAVSAVVLEQNLQSLLDCTDPSTQYGFDPSPYSKTVVVEDLVKYIETMYSGTRNKRRFEASERLHIFNVDAGMNVLDYDNYENLWFNHVDPTGFRSSASRAMLSATTEDELVTAIIQSTTASILCALRMHLIHFSAALQPSEFAKITSMLEDKNSVAYKNFKSVLAETMNDVFEAKGHPLEHFEAKIMNFESSEAWFSSMLSLVYAACPLTLDNPRGLKRSSCSVKVLEDSYAYFHEEEPIMNVISDFVAWEMQGATGITRSLDDFSDEAATIIEDEIWTSLSTKSFKFTDNRSNSSIQIEKGKILSDPSEYNKAFSLGYDSNGDPTIRCWVRNDNAYVTMPLFDANGEVSSKARWNIQEKMTEMYRSSDSDGNPPQGEFILNDVIAYENGRYLEQGFRRSYRNGKDELIRMTMHKKVSTGTLSNITTINFGNSAASGSPSQVYDNQIIGDVEPNDVLALDDYAEQVGNLEPGEAN